MKLHAPIILVLLAGAVALHAVFVDERKEHESALSREKQWLEALAGKMVGQELARELEARSAHFDAIASDVLLPDDGVLWVDAQGRQRLPRVVDGAPPVTPGAEALWNALPSPPGSDAEDRMALLRELDAALQKQRPEAIEQHFRALLQHRLMHRIPVTVDITTQLWALNALKRRANPDAALLHRVLRDGLKAGSTTLPGLQRLLVAERHRMHPEDVAFLSARMTALSDGAGIRSDDFLAALQRAPTPSWNVDPLGPRAQLSSRPDRYVERRADGSIMGIAVDLGAVMARVERSMQDVGMLRENETLAGIPEVLPSTVEELRIPVESGAYVQGIAQASHRYRLKSGMLVLGMLFAFAALAAGWLARRRREHFVELKSNFVSAVSHELRTPLASMRLIAETLERKLPHDGPAADYPARLLTEIDGLTVMVENLLSYNRLEKHRVELRRSRVSLKELVETVAHDVASHSALPVEFDLEQLADVVVDVDPTLLQLTFHNLFRNACQYNDRSPVRITISSTENGPVDILVADNGRGIPPEERGSVFEDFVRGSSARSHERGSGIGLAICREVMRLHGGSIAVHASSDAGTTFLMKLPARSGG